MFFYVLLSSVEYSATLAVLPWDAGASLRDCSLAAAGQEPATLDTATISILVSSPKSKIQRNHFVSM